ncbi:MAG: sugar phosphate nucleotidyltransferase [Chthoniobacterales bacterium]|nr:sugar phosphate nucleotidyltransferase [Chthoniobacterales bacterium]
MIPEISAQQPVISKTALPLDGVQAVILAGGRGTRLASLLPDIPKPLAPICGRPYLFYLLDYLAIRGVSSFVLCTGWLGEKIRSVVGDEWLSVPVFYSHEEEPLGTAGPLALANSRGLLATDPLLVVNADTWFLPNFRLMHQLLDQTADAVIAAVHHPSATRFGALQISTDNYIQKFLEKKIENSAGWINAGFYLIRRGVLRGIPVAHSSLEREFFPKLAARGRLRAALHPHAPFLDFGTPDDYLRAPVFFREQGLEPHSMFPDFSPGPIPPIPGLEARLGVCTVVVDNNGQVLLDLRSDCHRWALFGGRLEAGESVEQTAYRETCEETGLQIRIVRFLGFFSKPRWRIVCYPNNSDWRQLNDVAILTAPIRGSLTLSQESDELRWFDPAEVPPNLIRPAIEIFRQAFLGSATHPILA